MSLKELWIAWNNFWFATGSPIPLALFRIVIGFLVLIFCWWITPEAPTFFGVHAIVQPATVERWMTCSQLNIFQWLPKDDSVLRLAFVILQISGVCLIFGVFSRVSALVTYLIMLGLDSQNHFVLNTGIKVMIVMTLWLVFSRCGEALSVKRLVKIWRRNDPEFGPARDGSIFAQRLMQVQMAFVYLSAGACKLHGAAWIDGTAVYYAAHLTQFQRFAFPLLFDQLWACKLLSWGTLVFEMSFPFLIWIREFRYPLLLAGVLFHLGLDLAMVIPLFQLVMLSCYIPFLTAENLSFLMTGIRKLSHKFAPGKLSAYYDGESAVSLRIGETIKHLDILHFVDVLDVRSVAGAPRNGNGILVDGANNVFVGGVHAFRRLSIRLPLLQPFYVVSFLPGFWHVAMVVFRMLVKSQK